MSVENQITIGSKAGLHARPASQAAQLAGRFQSQIELIAGGRTVNLKSLIAVMSLGLKQGAAVTVRATGPDELEAAQAVTDLLSRDLD